METQRAGLSPRIAQALIFRKKQLTVSPVITACISGMAQILLIIFIRP